MAIINKSFQGIVVIGATDKNKAIIKQALSLDYKLFFASNIMDAMKFFLKYGNKIFEFIIDASDNSDLALSFIREWETDVALQIIPVVSIVEYEKRDIEQLLMNHGVCSFLYMPINEKRVKTHALATARRYAFSETRVQETYDLVLKNSKEKVWLVAEAIDSGLLFLKIEDEKIIVDYTNKSFKKILKIKDFEDLLDKLGIDGGSKLMSAINKSKLNYEPNMFLLNLDIDNENRSFDVVVRQIPNLDRQSYDQYVYKFIVTLVERTIRETMKQKYSKNLDLFNSVLNNIDGGVFLFTINDKKLELSYASDGVFKFLGTKKGDFTAIANMLPAYTYRKIQAEFYDKLPSIMSGREETIHAKTKIICANNVHKHAVITYVYNLGENGIIDTKGLIIDDTENYNYSDKLKKISELDIETGLFNYEKFANSSTVLFRSNDELEFRLLVIRIFKFDELISFFGKEKVKELLLVIKDGIIKFGAHTLKGRVDNKAFGLSFIKDKFDEKDFIKKLDNYVKENYKTYQVKLYYGVYNIDDVYESIDSILIQTTFGIKEIEGNALKNCIYCDSKLKNRMLETDNISNEMKQALANGEFEIFLQPVFDLRTRRIVSAEALTRWHHPKRGYIPPSEYVPIFEENGFIVNIDMFVWDGVCKIIRCWLDNGIPAVPISVNVSRIDLFSIDFYKVITELVEKYNIPVEYLRLEITESAFVLNEKSVVEIVDKLRKFGFKILMDDFGSGYSSLNSLKFINVDFLKIDMDLVKGMEESIRQANILKSVINLGTTLDLEMICEGVETEKQAAFVNDCGCGKAQGWLFSKAIPVDEFNKKIKQ